ncbi:MAG: hypothetical protein KatS3mg074_412 [Meiothermus sp.]|nr:hypothetical protein [Meiothermus hypogaeus]RIH78070.1 hypothetical protein Mhypo_01752 [Meiothermus hypogaeus]GIW38014.1 MAG: hypothetical protein KatS3mg074_412 [Meiothermus sp.]
MKLYWAEFMDSRSPPALRRRGLVQLSGLALALQMTHLALAWLAVPTLMGLPQWVTWSVSGFFALLLLIVVVLKSRPVSKQTHLEPARQVFLDALWLGAACLAAIFAMRMGFELGVVLFLGLGLVGYGIAFGRLWFGLSKA